MTLRQEDLTSWPLNLFAPTFVENLQYAQKVVISRHFRPTLGSMNQSEPKDIVIYDQTESCPYLEGRTARMPLRMPIGKITLAEADRRLAEGHRRTGEFVYQTCCPRCTACEPLRIPVARFHYSRNARRVLAKGDRQLQQNVGPLICDARRLSLFNRHRLQRGLAQNEASIDQVEYEWGFVKTCFDSFEISYWDQDRLVAVAICDRGKTSLSAVYTFFDPDYTGHSLGTYSIFKQIEFCQQQGLQYLYLGYYVAGSPHMEYKGRFLPQERLIDGVWQEFS